MSDRVIQVIGCDPGTVHFTVCRLSFRGFVYSRDDKGVTTKTPLFEVHDMELFDLERRITYRHNASYRVFTNKFGLYNNNVQDKSYLALSESLAHIIPNTKWMFETYKQLPTDEKEVLPVVAIENQPGMIKNHEVSVVLASYLYPCAIRTVDVKNGNNTRQILVCARKYGIPSKGEVGYDRRKELADEIGRSLLQLSGQLHWLEWLDAYEVARKRDVPQNKPKTDDLMDAMLLALYKAITLWEEAEKSAGRPQVDGPEVRLAGCTIDDDEVEPVILKKRKAPVKKVSTIKKKLETPKKRDIAAISDDIATGFEECTKNKRKRELIIDSDEEEEKPAKKPKVKKTPVATKYKQLELVTVNKNKK